MRIAGEYICEVCGRVEILTEKDAFDAGWDYPPFIGEWGVVSPRTCGNCGLEQTAYWAIITKALITDRHYATVVRIQGEVVPQ
jgi:hypothetical protein